MSELSPLSLFTPFFYIYVFIYSKPWIKNIYSFLFLQILEEEKVHIFNTPDPRRSVECALTFVCQQLHFVGHTRTCMCGASAMDIVQHIAQEWLWNFRRLLTTLTHSPTPSVTHTRTGSVSFRRPTLGRSQTDTRAKKERSSFIVYTCTHPGSARVFIQKDFQSQVDLRWNTKQTFLLAATNASTCTGIIQIFYPSFYVSVVICTKAWRTQVRPAHTLSAWIQQVVHCDSDAFSNF